MTKSQELEAARNLEPDCSYGAVGAGRYRARNDDARRDAAGLAKQERDIGDAEWAMLHATEIGDHARADYWRQRLQELRRLATR